MELQMSKEAYAEYQELELEILKRVRDERLYDYDRKEIEGWQEELFALMTPEEQAKVKNLTPSQLKDNGLVVTEQS
jgi:hypothetical protein